MNWRGYILSIVTICVTVIFYGQNLQRIEDLTIRLESETDHYIRAEILLELSRERGINDFEKALFEAKRALTIYQNLGHQEGLLLANMHIGELQDGIGNSYGARKSFQKAYELANQVGNQVELIRAQVWLSRVFDLKTDREKSLRLLEDALNRAEKLKNHALKVDVYIGLGEYYYNVGDYYTAEGYFKMAFNSSKLSEDIRYEAQSLKKLGYSYLRNNNNESALDAFNKSLRIFEQLHNDEERSVLGYEIGVLYQKGGDNESALTHLQNSLTLAEKVSNKEYIAKCYAILSNVYEKNKDYESAYRYLKHVEAIRGVSEISELQTQLENQKQLIQIQELQQVDAIKEKEIEGWQELLWIAAIFLVVCTIFIGYLFYSNNQKKKVNEELAKAKEQAELSEREKERFLTYTSHEIRTPLNAVVGVSQLLEKTKLDLKQQEYVNTVKGSAQNILHIVNDVLDLSKIESGGLELALVPVSLKKTIDSMIHSLLFKVKDKSVRLINDFDNAIPGLIKTDPVRLNQVILNLADNAVKFTREGHVSIRTRLQSSSDQLVRVRFEVEDTGKGIRKSSLDQIFKRYEQETIHTTRHYGGTGLGLPITKQLIELMGGQIEVSSVYGEGTTFAFELAFQPVNDEALAQEEEIEKVSNLRLLYVDDNVLNRELFHDLVTDASRNISVDLADDGSIALRKMEQKEYDVILLDLQMPRMDGYEVAQLIRSKFDAPKNNVPIIAVSAHAKRAVWDRCEAAQITDYLSKPIDLDLLNQILIEHTDEKRPVLEQSVEDPQTALVNNSVDLTELYALVRGNKGKIQKYVDICVNNMPPDLEEIKSALDHEDWEQIGKTAHKMKGNAGYMGMKKVLPLLHELEMLRVQVGDYHKIADIVAALDQEVTLALKSLTDQYQP